MSPDQEYDLVHKNVTTIARGDQQSILKLKSTLEELVVELVVELECLDQTTVDY
jgi:hypothetical protein